MLWFRPILLEEVKLTFSSLTTGSEAIEAETMTTLVEVVWRKGAKKKKEKERVEGWKPIVRLERSKNYSNQCRFKNTKSSSVSVVGGK